MVSATDYPRKPGLSHDQAIEFDRPRKRRFRLLAALAAPFKDMDDRALHKKRGRVDVRNNSKGNMFTPRATTTTPVPVRRFRHGDD